MDKGGIGVSNLPNQRYRTVFKKPLKYNIMVVGANGLGKTTFLNMFLNSNIIPDTMHPDENNSMRSFLDDSEDFLEQNNKSVIRKNSFLNFKKYNVNVTEKGFNVHFSAIEVDNVGNGISNEDCWVPIEKYINRQYKIFYEKENSSIKSNICDTRIHACLYFCDPSSRGLKLVDMCAIKKISKICNLIPIISKADMLSPNMIELLERNVICDFKLEGIECFKMSPNNGSEFNNELYFSICARKNSDNEYIREYPWGYICALNSDYNDFKRIKEILLNKGFCKIMEMAEIFYSKYKTGKYMKKLDLRGSISGTKLQNEESICFDQISREVD